MADEPMTVGRLIALRRIDPATGKRRSNRQLAADSGDLISPERWQQMSARRHPFGDPPKWKTVEGMMRALRVDFSDLWQAILTTLAATHGYRWNPGAGGSTLHLLLPEDVGLLDDRRAALAAALIRDLVALSVAERVLSVDVPDGNAPNE